MEKKKRNNQRGAVTVFLVLILVPCFVFLCAFSDISRVKLSEARAESAADLALYATMSQYDETLKEYYGLVASCQTIDEFYDSTEEYFLGMMDAEGMPDTGEELFIQYIEALRNGNFSDLLQTSLTAEEIQVETAKDSTLGSNAALLEDGIVEFMKYRGPVEIVTNLVERFSNMDFSGAADAAANSEVVDAKQEAAEAEGELLKAALYSYIAMKQYQDVYVSTDVPSISGYGTISAELKKIYDDYKGVTQVITRYQAGTSGITMLNFPTWSLTTTLQPSDVGTKVEDGDNTLYCIDNATLQGLIGTLDTKIQSVETAQSNIVSSCAQLPGSVTASVNPVRYCLAVQNAISSSDLSTMTTAGNQLKQLYNQLNAAKSCDPYPENSDLPAGWQTQIEDAMDRIAEIQQKYYTTSATTSYMQLANRYTSTAVNYDVIDFVNECRGEFSSEFLGSNTTIGSFQEAVRDYMNSRDTELAEQYDRLDIILNGGTVTYHGTTYQVESLSTLLQLAQEYSAARDDWGSAALNAGTEYGDEEYEIYSGDVDEDTRNSAEYQSTVKSDSLALALDSEAVNDMIARIKNIMSDITACRDAIQAVTYGGTPVMNITGRKELITLGETVIPGSQSLYYSENDSAAEGYYGSLIAPAGGCSYTAPSLTTGERGNNPDLNTDCELYRFLTECLGGSLEKIEENVKSNDKQNDQLTTQATKEQEAAESVDSDFLRGVGENLTDVSGGAKLNEATIIGSIVSLAQNIASGEVDELRDQLYVCEYIMDMFSYSSFNNEGIHTLVGEEYTWENNQAESYEEEWSTWTTDDKAEVYDNQSLTNYHMDAATHRANLAEVEYILYGNANYEDNLSTAYRQIFEIRETFNLVSGFQNFYSGTANNTTATAITSISYLVSSATGGIVPIPLTKSILITVLATMESAHDLTCLKGGESVVLYKSVKDWYYAWGGSGTTASRSTNQNYQRSGENGFYYSDYMYLFVLIGLTNSNHYSDMLIRVGDLIQANMRKVTKDDSYDLDKAVCYFQLSATVEVNPLFLSLPFVDNLSAVDVSAARESTGWRTYEVKVIRGYS